MYRFIAKTLLFLWEPEKAHHLVMNGLALILRVPGARNVMSSLFGVHDSRLHTELCGLTFKNPVGLAAGFDKDGKYAENMALLGFGFIEIGTITPRPQAGNPKPRLFRLVSDHALINRLGFNNEGVEMLKKRLVSMRKNGVVIGGNIGKNKDTPNEKAVDDYLICLKTLYPWVDYFAINVSSPNTPGLRALLEKEPLTELLSAIMSHSSALGTVKPVFLKISPDVDQTQLDDILEVVQKTGVHGIIATNTTIGRDGLTDRAHAHENGGLSGRPVKSLSTEIIRYLSHKTEGKLPIIGVGGIESPEDAIEKMYAGASLVQVYTGLVYAGPGLVKDINQRILAVRLSKNG
jgi:dihydroorotate dehydrogenase